MSRPTVYRYFGSKEGLLDAFGLYEQDNFDSEMAAATAGLTGPDRVDAALHFIVDFQSTHSLGSLVEMEPELERPDDPRAADHGRGHRAHHDRRRRCLAAAAVVRIAVCHYLIAAAARPVPGRAALCRRPRHVQAPPARPASVG